MLHYRSKLITSFTLIMGLLWLSGCDVMNPFAESASEVRTQLIPYVPDTGVKVTTQNGYIDVIADANRMDVELVANVKASGNSQEEAEARLQEVLIRIESKTKGDNTPLLEISVEYPDNVRRNNEGCSFTLHMPTVNGCELNSSNGHLKTVGLAGAADLRTSNGKITVTDHDGAVTAQTSNGQIAAENVTGDINATTSNGGVNISKAQGFASVKTSNGVIDYKGLSGFDLHTSNGSIKVEISRDDLAGIGSIDTQTSNGSINIIGIGISISGTKHHKIVIPNNTVGGSAAIARTSNGSITIKIMD